jgi:uncharacterized membrane protein
MTSMDEKTYLRIALGLALGGTAFSGYLSAVRLLTGSCAFDESCPFFLGYPACWYGFAMFASIFATGLVSYYGDLKAESAAKIIGGISFLGTVFAGHFVWIEISSWLAAGNSGYPLVLPTCVYGLTFYLAVLVLSVWMITRSRVVPA